jgi:hypothetical protein
MSNPYEPPRNFNLGPMSHGGTSDTEQLVAIAAAQRNVNLALGAYLCCALLRIISPLFGGIGALIAFVCSLVFAYTLAKALHGTGIAVVCMVLMFVPCANLITLLLLSSQATRRLKAAGIPVGFLGTSADQVRSMLGG